MNLTSLMFLWKGYEDKSFRLLLKLPLILMLRYIFSLYDDSKNRLNEYIV